MAAGRSQLIMPANRADMLAKAPSYGADALIFDLEDSVPVAEKAKARALARQFIAAHKGKSTLYVRVNAVQTGLLEQDLDAVVTDGLAGIKLPKAESPHDMRTVDAMLTALETSRGLAPGSIAIGPTLESAKGVWFAYDILSASRRIQSVMPGTAQDADLQTDLGYTSAGPDSEMLLCIRSHVVLAARAAGVEHVLDGVYANIHDPGGLRKACEAARKLGYRGKQVIHPNQIAVVNSVFTINHAVP
jgi:citrate lyase subunit beta/citryl-CoA lyase